MVAGRVKPRQIAEPMPPVTRVRFISGLSIAPHPEHYRRASVQQQAVARGKAEAIEQGVVVARETFRHDGQIGGNVIQTRDQETDAAHAGQVAGARRRIDRRPQGTVGGHGLGGVFDAAGHPQPAMGAQGMVGAAVAVGGATDADIIPGIDPVQQAHAALMRDVGEQPGVV